MKGGKAVRHGKNFENSTLFKKRIKGIRVLRQYEFKKYFQKTIRLPDEAFINERSKTIKILEKKSQSVNGSVETKLWAGPALKREYELMYPKYKIDYAFCISNFLKEKINSNCPKYKNLKQILKENNIKIFYGDSKGYFKIIEKWIKE